MTSAFDPSPPVGRLSRAKWEGVLDQAGDPGLLSFGTADIDFRSPPAVIAALTEMVVTGHFGYPFKTASYYATIIDHFRRRAGWTIEREWLRSAVGVYASMHVLVEQLTEPGDEIVFQTPVHHIFHELVEANGRVPVENPLVLTGDGYRMDLDGLADLLGPRTGLFLLCNPHNPVGRAWNRDELQALGRLCLDRGTTVVADEVYFGLVPPPAAYVPFASVSPEHSRASVTLTSASKTYNLTGLKHSLVISENADLLAAFDRGQRKENSYFGGSMAGIVATEAALAHGDAWLAGLMEYVADNRALLTDWFAEHAPEVVVHDAESTYFAWLDCRAWGMADAELMSWLATEVRIVLTAGHELGTGGSGHVRWNLACPRETLEEGLARLRSALMLLSSA